MELYNVVYAGRGVTTRFEMADEWTILHGGVMDSGYCLDAPDRIPGGSHEYNEYGDFYNSTFQWRD